MSNDDSSSYFDAAAQLAGLKPRPEHREEALAAFVVLMDQARLVMDFSLPAETEAAPRFSP